MRCVAGIFKQEPTETFLDLEGVEEFAVLVVVEIDVKFLVPDHASVPCNIHHFEKECVAHQVVH